MLRCTKCKELTLEEELYYNNEIEKFPFQFDQVQFEFNNDFEFLCVECYEEEIRSDYTKNIE